MKKLLKLFLISTAGLWLVNWLFPEGLVLTGDFISLLKAGAGLTLANWLVRPLFKMIMLPFNLLTFGLFRWVTNVVMLWLVVRFVGGVAVQPFQFGGLNYAGIVLPSLTFTQLTAWIAIPFLLALISSLLIWVTGK